MINSSLKDITDLIMVLISQNYYMNNTRNNKKNNYKFFYFTKMADNLFMFWNKIINFHIISHNIL